MNKLYTDCVKEENDTPESFLNKFLSKKDYGIQFAGHATFNDEKLEDLECQAYKHRSFEAIVRVLQTYFDITDVEISKLVKSMIEEKNLGFLYCGTADDWVLQYKADCWDRDKNYVLDYKNSQNELYRKGENKTYTMEDILELMNQ